MTASNSNTNGQSKVDVAEFAHTLGGQNTVATNSVTPTDFTREVTETTHTSETHKGHEVDFVSTRDTDVTEAGKFDDRIRKIAHGEVVNAINEREARENIRANHRNLNRMLTLFGALFIGLALTWLFQHNGIPGLFQFPLWFAKDYEPYTFVITIAMDSGLALYGLIRHY